MKGVKATPPRISDHALCRWLERVRGVDVEAFRRQMAEAIGSVTPVGEFVVRIDDVRFLIKNGVVVTTVEAEQRRLLPGFTRATV
jgi:hypothetical protein